MTEKKNTVGYIKTLWYDYEDNSISLDVVEKEITKTVEELVVQSGQQADELLTATTIIKEQQKLLKDIWDYRHGNGEYNFSSLLAEDRITATIEAWEEIELRIQELVRK